MIKKITLTSLLLAIIFLGGLYLRLWNLGYSDYQGDEIKALFIIDQNKNIMDFLLDQRKGPNQFLVTLLMKGVSDNYDNYLAVRLPFAIAGFLALVFFYLIVKKIFNQQTAMIASVFFATNGFLVAFSRIVQYQSFVIFLGLLSIYLYLIFRDRGLYRFLYFSFVALSLSILFHYDGVFFGVFIGTLALFDWYKSNSKKNFFKHLFLSGLLFLTILSMFYIPFILNLSDKTLDYWSGRISGNVSGKISSSFYLFTVYQPIYVVHVYTIMTVVGISAAILCLIIPILRRYFTLPKFTQPFKIDSMVIASLLWFGVPLIFMEVLVSIPGTHIYTYLIPAMILMAFGAQKGLEIFKHQQIRNLFLMLFGVLGLFIWLQSNQIFVDNTKEYPWQEEKFLIFTMNKPTATMHLSLFGFPYGRSWKDVREFLKDKTEYYSTNERDSISRYFVKLRKESSKMGYYVHIDNPQKLTSGILHDRALSWSINNEPVVIFMNPNGNNTSIYLIPSDWVVPENYQDDLIKDTNAESDE